MRVVIVAEYYPRASDPTLGIWAHRQAIAARDAGADVRVLVLHRPIPPLSAFRRGDMNEIFSSIRQPLHATIDGISVTYVPFIAPPRPSSYDSWSAWAAPSLGWALKQLHKRFPFELIHAHYAAPAGEAVRRTGLPQPLLISVHGGDVLAVAQKSQKGRIAVENAFSHSKVVMANSRGTELICQQLGATNTRVVRLGTTLPNRTEPLVKHPVADISTLGHLIERKRHIDVLEAIGLLKDSHPDLRWTVIGDGPERPRLERRATELGLKTRVRFTGKLPHDQALAEARNAKMFALPSVNEAFGVAYIEAMAGRIPAIGCREEFGPEEIAQAGEGMVLTEPKKPEALAELIADLIENSDRRVQLGESARETIEREFTWERCGAKTIDAYQDALTN